MRAEALLDAVAEPGPDGLPTVTVSIGVRHDDGTSDPGPSCVTRTPRSTARRRRPRTRLDLTAAAPPGSGASGAGERQDGDRADPRRLLLVLPEPGVARRLLGVDRSRSAPVTSRTTTS